MNMTRIRQICLRLSKLKKTDYIVILLVGVLLLIVVLPVKAVSYRHLRAHET